MFDRAVALLARGRVLVGTVGATLGPAVDNGHERVQSGLSGGGLAGGQSLWLGRLLIAVIPVPHLCGAVGRADRQIHGLPLLSP